MPLTEQQILAISVTWRVCSAVSLTSACTTVLTFLLNKTFRKPINRLIFYALLGNIMLNVGTIIGRSGIQRGTQSSLCQFQAFLIQWFFPVDAIWALCIAWNVYLIVFRQYGYSDLRQLEWRYMLFCYLLPFIPALVFLFVQTAEKGKIYGSAACWISMEWDVLRIVGLYGPVWFIVVLIFAIYIRVGLHIYSEIKQFPSTSTGHCSSYGLNRIDGSSMTETYHMTPARSPQCEESSVRRQETAIDSVSDTHGFDGRRSSLDTAARAYLRHAFLFFIALLVTWVPSSANRLSTLIDPEYVSFGLQYAASLVIPLQGFWNCLIYFNISRAELKTIVYHIHDDIALKVRRSPFLSRFNSQPRQIVWGHLDLAFRA